MAIARRYFVGVEQTQLETWLSWINEEMATGKVNSGWSAGDTSAQKHVDMSLPPRVRRDMILNDLSILDPDDYPPRDLAPIKRTVPRYIC